MSAQQANEVISKVTQEMLPHVKTLLKCEPNRIYFMGPEMYLDVYSREESYVMKRVREVLKDLFNKPWMGTHMYVTAQWHVSCTLEHKPQTNHIVLVISVGFKSTDGTYTPSGVNLCGVWETRQL